MTMTLKKMDVQPRAIRTVVLCVLYSMLSIITFVNISKPYQTRIFRTLIRHASTDVLIHSLYFTRLVGEGYSKIPASFRHVMSDSETLVYTDLLQTLDHVTRANNITMFMNYGTLLGSVRHHAFTPWDDDCDVAIPMSRRKDMLRLLYNMTAVLLPVKQYSKPPQLSIKDHYDYTWIGSAYTQIRFISRTSKQYNPTKWPLRWPYVDIDFYSENTTHIWFKHNPVLTYRRSIVFPLVSRPMSGVWLQSPRNFIVYLNETYGALSTCKSSSFSHRMGIKMKSDSRECATFNNGYPRVHRSRTSDNVTRETLILGNRTLYTVAIGE